jgi:hypothetical protein
MGLAFEFGIRNSEFGISTQPRLDITVSELTISEHRASSIEHRASSIEHRASLMIPREEEIPHGNRRLAQPSLKQVQAGGQPAA